MAIVTWTYHAKGTYGAKPYEHFGRFTDTWVSQDGKWLCVASHTSLLKNSRFFCFAFPAILSENVWH